MDGALVVNEAVYCIKKAKTRAALLKLDFQKAYDMVDWNFLNQVLELMGFGSTWHGWINHCISTALSLLSSMGLHQILLECIKG